MARARGTKSVKSPKIRQTATDKYIDETLLIAKYILKTKGPEAALEVLDERTEALNRQANRTMDQG